MLTFLSCMKFSAYSTLKTNESISEKNFWNKKPLRVHVVMNLQKEHIQGRDETMKMAEKRQKKVTLFIFHALNCY